MSPQHVPATVTELSRVPLFAPLAGTRLAELAARMERSELAAGTTVIREGEGGERFFVLLSGMAQVWEDTLGERRVLKAGDTFGQIALATGVLRTASVRAITPIILASCDRETFDELVRPLFVEY